MTQPQPIDITTLDGCVLRGHLWPGGHDWVVLVHDVGPDDDLDDWHPLLPGLKALDVSMCAVDLRGHGASDGEWTDTTAVSDVVTVVRFARANGAAVVIVIGAGVAVLPVLAAGEREPIDGVVSLSADMRAKSDGPALSNAPELGADRYLSTNGERAVISRHPIHELPRSAGIPKLFIVGAHDHSARETTSHLHRASIGWSVIVTLPSGEHGTGLLVGEWLAHIREQIAGFVRERRYLARAKTTTKGGRQ